jgi:uncharacterized damage-inducible protein DinB
MKRVVFVRICLCLCFVPLMSFSQDSSNPLTAAAKHRSDFVKGNIMQSAEMMKEQDYSFHPTPEVRSFGAILGHIANSNYRFCSQAAGTENPSKTDIEKTVTTKADLVKQLNQSFAYCDSVFATMSDEAGSEFAKRSEAEDPRLARLEVNTNHNFEHYGNLIVYLRLKGLVPPSTTQALGKLLAQFLGSAMGSHASDAPPASRHDHFVVRALLGRLPA